MFGTEQKSSLLGLSESAQSLLQEINFPAHFAPEFHALRFVETHLSLVIIGAQYTLKLKKSVTLPFVDHQLLKQRWQSSVSEVLLNRRLSSDLYLGVMPIISGKTNYTTHDIITQPNSLNLPYNTKEVAVVMHTFPAEESLLSLIKSDKLNIPHHIAPLARYIARFHDQRIRVQSKQSPSSHTAAEYVANLKRLFEDNISFLNDFRENLSAQTCLALEFLQQYAQDFFQRHEPDLSQRFENGLVVDAHGDLRSEHVIFHNERINIIDCIEFSDELRTVDVLNDIAFLCMDLDWLRSGAASRQLLKDWSTELADVFDRNIFLFFCVYRALVRAKIDCILSQQSNLNAGKKIFSFTQKHIALACRYARDIAKPFALVLCGPMGTGKSTLADYLQAQSYATVYRSDRLRKILFGDPGNSKTTPFGQGIYSSSHTDQTYAELLSRAQKQMALQNPIILDASFAKRAHRHQVAEAATFLEIPYLFVCCKLSKGQTIERLELRSKDAESDGRAELLDMQLANFDNITDDEQLYCIELDMSLPLALQAQKVFDALRLL